MYKYGDISKRAVVTFLSLLILCSLATYLLVERKYQIEYIKMERIVLNQGHKLSTVLAKLLYKTEALSALVIQHSGQMEHFSRVASTLLDDPAIINVLVAPDGVVSDVHPREGNEAALGLNFFSEGAGNKEAIQARDEGRMILGGPFSLVQGGEALVGRLPVYLNAKDGQKTFWGLVSVTLKFPQALDGADLNKLAEMGLAYELWRINPDTEDRQVIAHSDYEYNKNAPYLEMPITLFNAQWFFRISPIKLWYQYAESWLYIAFGAIVSFLLAVLVQHNYDLRRIRGQLENMVYQDVLTGTLNRRGLFERLSGLTEAEGHFYLYYLDLDDFKSVNDTYGHSVGDRVLQVFTNEVQNHMKTPHIFARIGGDEFILIVKGGQSGEKTEKCLENIRQALRSRTVQEGVEDIRISFCVGKAVYPRDGKNIDALIAHADSDMYKEKRSRA